MFLSFLLVRFLFLKGRKKGRRANLLPTENTTQTSLSFLFSLSLSLHNDDNDSWVSAKLTYGFITRAYAKDAALCRLMFFSDELADAEVERFVRLLRENDGETPVLDVRELPKQVPLPPLLEDQGSSPSPSSSSAAASASAALWPAYVLGGREDTIVDEQACVEIAEWAGIPTSGSGQKASRRQQQQQQLVMIEGLAHDCMLDARWREAADSLLLWAEGV